MAITPTSALPTVPQRPPALLSDCAVVELAGLPGCGKTTVLDALRSRLRSRGIDMLDVRRWSDVYGASPLSWLPGRPDRYLHVIATTIKEPRLVFALGRRAFAAGGPPADGTRWVCQVIRMRRGIRALRGTTAHRTGTVVLDSGICFSLANFLHFGRALPPPYEPRLVAAALGGIIDGVVHFESNVAECYARAVPRTGWEHAWMGQADKEQMLAAMGRMNEDLRRLVEVVESLGIPTLRVPWETTVDERVTLVEEWLLHNQSPHGDRR